MGASNVQIDVHLAQPGEDRVMAREVREGLGSDPKHLPSKYFYDERGSALFERITELPEYYLTRAELEILATRGSQIAALAGPRCALIEYGSGAGVKVRRLLDALDEPVASIPVDISHEQLARVADDLVAEYSRVAVRPVWADYTAPFQLPWIPAGVRRVAFFPGSTIGNFHPTEAAAFLNRVRRTIGPTGALILGVDRRKKPEVLEAAYNDAAGVTAEFTLNLLARLNRELGSDFDLAAFRHRAVYARERGRIETSLVSRRKQVVTIAGRRFAFAADEAIDVEISSKYTDARFDALAAAAGLRVARRWNDPRDWFGLRLLQSA